MQMFENPQDEQQICLILRALVEEWGPENVVVRVPSSWQYLSWKSLGEVALEFCTKDSISVVAGQGDSIINREIKILAHAVS